MGETCLLPFISCGSICLTLFLLPTTDLLDLGELYLDVEHCFIRQQQKSHNFHLSSILDVTQMEGRFAWIGRGL